MAEVRQTAMAKTARRVAPLNSASQAGTEDAEGPEKSRGRLEVRGCRREGLENDESLNSNFK